MIGVELSVHGFNYIVHVNVQCCSDRKNAKFYLVGRDLIVFELYGEDWLSTCFALIMHERGSS